MIKAIRANEKNTLRIQHVHLREGEEEEVCVLRTHRVGKIDGSMCAWREKEIENHGSKRKKASQHVDHYVHTTEIEEYFPAKKMKKNGEKPFPATGNRKPKKKKKKGAVQESNVSVERLYVTPNKPRKQKGGRQLGAAHL